jgi:hypothetical protein
MDNAIGGQNENLQPAKLVIEFQIGSEIRRVDPLAPSWWIEKLPKCSEPPAYERSILETHIPLSQESSQSN